MIVGVDENGSFVDDAAEGQEVTNALVANHAVEVQREAALLFVYELVFRQEAVAAARKDDGSFDQIDVRVAAADRDARAEFSDRIHGGWLQAATSIAQRAVEAELPLAVRYVVDVLPTREQVAHRVPLLRAAYNNIDIAREAVDKQVSLIGGRDPRLNAPGLTQDQEDKIQRQLSAMGLRHWISQTVRDALVCGNGYFVTVSDPEPTGYALRPEAVEILGAERFAVLNDGVASPVTNPVLHIRGIEQFESPYGISLLEPVLAIHRTREALADATRTANQVLAKWPEDSEQARWAQATLALAQRGVAETDARLGELLAYPRDWLHDARDGLYFPGQEKV
ncbi:MAG: hypothetical protein ACLPV4_21245 [Solirubrobacteraceae bacterium]